MQHKAAKRQAGTRSKRDRWFYELLDLASEGNAEAVQDLWLTYQHDFARNGRGDE